MDYDLKYIKYNPVYQNEVSNLVSFKLVSVYLERSNPVNLYHIPVLSKKNYLYPRLFLFATAIPIFLSPDSSVDFNKNFVKYKLRRGKYDPVYKN